MLCMMHGAGFPTPQFQPADRRTLLAAVLPQLDALYARYAEQHRVPGLIYGVLLDGELVHTWSQGTRRVGQDAPVDADTVFRIASMSKSFAALAVVMLRDAGKLRLDDPRRGLRAGTGAARIPDPRQPADHRAPTAHHVRRLARG
jgi:CubicO group peptidase (beta-lactamase class C family)